MPTLQPPTVKTITLPAPNPNSPLITRVISGPLLFEGPVPQGETMWLLGDKNPIVPESKIVRMIRRDDGVSIYSVPMTEVGMPLVHHLPIAWVRFVEGASDLELFLDDLYNAEEKNEPPLDDDEPPDPTPGDEPSDEPNGAGASEPSTAS